jgi:hypothetical protein
VATDVHAGKDPGKPQDALEELVRAVAKPAGPTPDPDVPVAFAAGWHAGEAMLAAKDADGARIELLCAQIRGDVSHLRKRLTAVEQDLAGLGEAIDALAHAPADTAAADTVGTRFGAQLLAADFKLGKGFSLGRAIAMLFSGHEFAAAGFRTQLLADHDALQDWLSQLATALPPNAGHSVRDSLNMWGAALADDQRVGALRQEQVVQQGERWRSLLSGEKAGKDALELTDYVGVAEGVVMEIRSLARRALREMWGLVLAVVVLFVAGVAAIVIWQHSAGSAAGIASIVTALGLTWKGLGNSLGRAIARVEQPAWDAQVDRAIAYAITRSLPDDLVGQPPKGTLLGGLHEWRRHHARPPDQGRRRSRQTPS